jgi:hypothetical protein
MPGFFTLLADFESFPGMALALLETLLYNVFMRAYQHSPGHSTAKICGTIKGVRYDSQ